MTFTFDSNFFKKWKWQQYSLLECVRILRQLKWKWKWKDSYRMLECENSLTCSFLLALLDSDPFADWYLSLSFSLTTIPTNSIILTTIFTNPTNPESGALAYIRCILQVKRSVEKKEFLNGEYVIVLICHCTYTSSYFKYNSR